MKTRTIGGVCCDFAGECKNVGDFVKVHFCFGTWEADGEIEKARSQKGRIGFIAHARFLDGAEVFSTERGAADFLASNFRAAVSSANRELDAVAGG